MDRNSHINYILQLADNALVLGHRNSEWTGYGPILEQDIALSNIALDLIGQARYLYQHAAKLAEAAGTGRVTEDTLAYGRDAWDFRNCLLVEQKNGDWGKTILRQFLFSAWQYFFYEQLQQSRDSELAAIAEKSYKEVVYHLRWSSEWVIRPLWEDRVGEVLAEAGLEVNPGAWMQTGGKEGRHTEELGYLLAEMQFLQRAYPGCEW